LTSGSDSRERLEQGDLVLNNNIWWLFGAGSTLESIIPQDFVRTYFNANNNQVVDPQINSISREHNGGLDPRPASSGPAGSGAVAPSDPYFVTTSYYGAFNPNAPLWTSGWTALSQTGVTSINDFDMVNEIIPDEFSLSQNFPNPFNPSTKINFAIPKSDNIKIAVYNILGQEMAVLVDGFVNAGSYEINWDASNLPSGVYVYSIQSANINLSKKMTLLK
ncbi:MAG: T9SS type A sorting domain-containing protein, partial [Ignavibacteriaceae bacterium]